MVLHREAAGQDPDARRPTLVAGLAQLADLLLGTEARDEAAAVREEAVDHAPAPGGRESGRICRCPRGPVDRSRRSTGPVPAMSGGVRGAGGSSLCPPRCLHREPREVQGELAASLHVQGGRLTDAGLADPARAAFTEAVVIRRELARESLLPHRVGLAESLAGLGHAVGMSGRAAEASAWFRKGLALLRRHERTRPDEAAWALAAALRPTPDLGITHTYCDVPAGQRRPRLSVAVVRRGRPRHYRKAAMLVSDAEPVPEGRSATQAVG